MLRAYKETLKTAESLAMVCLTDEANQNLSHAQKMLLKWHFKLGHIGFQHLQWIGRQGWLHKVGEHFGLSSILAPKCAACQFGKQQRNPKKGNIIKREQPPGVLKKEKLEPGDLIFSD